MNRRLMSVCILVLAGITAFRATRIKNHQARAVSYESQFRKFNFSVASRTRGVNAARVVRTGRTAGRLATAASVCGRDRTCAARMAIPMSFEPNVGQFDRRVQYVGRGAGMTLLLTRSGMDVELSRCASGGDSQIKVVRLRFGRAVGSGRGDAAARFSWRGEQALETVSNYFMGNDPRAWRTNVRHFGRAAGKSVTGQQLEVAVYGTRGGVEYDLRLAPGENARNLRMWFSGASHAKILNGDLMLDAGGRELRIGKPRIYEESADGQRPVSGGYVIETDGSMGLRVGQYNSRATLVVDPSLSVAYATFLGGAGSESAGNVAIDASGKVYVSGVTDSATTFPETSARWAGPVVGASAFYVAKIDPTVSGANSLLYLTFLGGSGTQTGGLIALDGVGDVALMGTTTSLDFPVTGSSQPTQGLTSGSGNDAIVSEINAVGNQLNFSVYFGGSGTISANGTGGIAVDSTGTMYIASDAEQGAADTSSPDLPVTTNAYQTAWDGQYSDGFLAVFAPPAQAGSAPTLTYCTYLGTNAEAVGIGGVGVDSNGNAYVAGTVQASDDAVFGFPAQNALQSAYGGGSSDGFVMQIAPLGQGPSDLVYATLLGGSGMDDILGVALDPPGTLPVGVSPKAYVVGETQSTDFPTLDAYQNTLGCVQPESTCSSTNVFLAAIAQDAVSHQTSLAYSTYLGGASSDLGHAVAVTASSSVYVVGSTDSVNFPWRDNLQAFNTGDTATDTDAFLAKFDTTSSGAASLIYSTPLGGMSAPGGSAPSAATGVAANGSGEVYVTGQTAAENFPTAITSSGAQANGFQQECDSCQSSPPAADAFIAEISESSAPLPSVYFGTGVAAFGSTSLGGNISLPVAVFNGGEQNLTISDIEVQGADASQFVVQIGPSCINSSIPPGPLAPGQSPPCSVEVNFTPELGGVQEAYMAVWDNAPGSPQLLELKGTGVAPHATIAPVNLNFGNQPVNTTRTLPITLTNSGTQNLNISELLWSGSSAFYQDGDGLCHQGGVLTPGEQCDINVVFAPTNNGAVQGQITIVDNSDLQSNAQQVATVSGTGTPPEALAQVVPAALTFGSTLTGATSGSQSVTLQNEGSAALDVSAISIGGTNGTEFEIAIVGTTCPVTGGTVPAGGQCTVAVQFAPQSAGASKTATLNFTDNATPSPQTVMLSGTATSPVSITVSPGSLAFGDQSEGTASTAQIVTITNSGSAPASISGIAITGSTDFVQSNACSPVLSAGAQCQVSVTFEPAENATAGARAATLKIPGGTPSSVALSGTATVPAVSFTTSLSFASQLAGTTGVAQPVTITNSSSGALAGALAFTGISISGTNKADFSITTNQCPASGAAVAPGGSCTVDIAFTPHAAATCGGDPNRSAVLQLQDNAPGSPQTIPLSGAAADFCLASSNGEPVTTPIQPGQTASYSMEVASSGGFVGTVDLSCSVASTGTELGPCAIATSPTSNPASVQVTPTAPGEFTVNVPTVAPSDGFGFGRPRGFGPISAHLRSAEILLAGCAWLTFLFLFAIVAPRHRRSDEGARRGLRLVRLIQMSALTIGLLLGTAGCGSAGGSDPVSDPGTTPGAYTITVTASTTGANATTRTATLTLTIEPPSS